MLIQTDMAVGAETSALATYRRAVASLREIGLAPREATERLLRRAEDRRQHRPTPPGPTVGVR